MFLTGIELSSVCQLRCAYCPQSNFHRVRKHMPESVFALCLEIVADQSVPQIQITGIGESTLHPRFCEYVERLRLATYDKIVMPTNGISLDVEKIKACQKAGVQICISPHQPEEAAKALRRCIDNDMPVVLLGMDMMSQTHDWAGQVDWLKWNGPRIECEWLANEHVTCQSDGMISSCCYNASDKNLIGHIANWHSVSMKTGPGELCPTCHYDVPEKYVQLRTP